MNENYFLFIINRSFSSKAILPGYVLKHYCYNSSYIFMMDCVWLKIVRWHRRWKWNRPTL